MAEEQQSNAAENLPPGNPWKLKVLGGFRLTDPNGVEASGLGKPDRALLVYLVLSGRQRQPRARLAALLWPNRSEALHSLSVSLNALRRALGDKDGSIIVPKSDPLVCRFDSFDVDALTFEALISQDGLDSLEQAEALYSGDLLDGIDIKSEEFDRWIALERERLRGLAVDCFRRLMRLRREAEQSQRTLETAQRILRLDELCEDAHRTIVGTYLQAGQRPAARKHARYCEELFRRENLEAEPETVRLLLEVRKAGVDEPGVAEAPHPPTSNPAFERSWNDAPAGAVTVGNLPDGDEDPSVTSQLKSTAGSVSVYSVRLDARPARRVAGHQSAVAHRWRYAAAAAVVVAAVMISVFLLQRSPSSLPLPDRPSIVVLPFEYLSGDPKWARLADGLTVDVTNNLYRSRDLFVIARHSAEIYKGKPLDLRAVGRDLGVEFVLEGTVQSWGDSMRVTATLAYAESSQIRWEYRYVGNASAENMFHIQDDVTANIAGRLLGNEGALNEAEREKLRRKPPADLTAYDYYLMAMQVKHELTKEDIQNARRLFNMALELDRGLARAHVGLAWADELEVALGYADSVAETHKDKFKHANEAIALDPNDGEAYAARATYYADVGKFEAARDDFQRAVELAPNNADILLLHGANLPQLGDPDGGAEAVQRAVRLNPHFPLWYHRGLRNAYYFAGLFDDAFKAAEKSGTSTANDCAWLAVAAAQSGRIEDAKAWAIETLQYDSDWSAERRMSDFGKFARDKEPLLFAEGARKAGLPVCATAAQVERWSDMTPLPGCEEERASK